MKIREAHRYVGCREWTYGFQDPGTPVAEGIVRLHHELIVVLVFVCGFVLWMLIRVVIKYKYKADENIQISRTVHGRRIERVWTRVPCIILVIVAIPSFGLLYSAEERVAHSMTVKVVGHQWYWSYEYSDSVDGSEKQIEYDSYMLPEDERQVGELRLLEVDNRMVRPIDTHVRVIVTSGDVLHSWAVPGLGVKIDACPGRLNQVSRYRIRPGVYYGQCSELCGVNHGFIPIVVEGKRIADYIKWRASM